MNYYIITPKHEYVDGLKLHAGLNMDHRRIPRLWGSAPGGICFARESILTFLGDGIWLRKVEVPDDAYVVHHGGPNWDAEMWRANKVMLGRRERITPKVVDRLLQEGADVHVDGDYPISWAVTSGSVTMVRVLLKHGANVNPSVNPPLWTAVRMGDVKKVRLLLEYGADRRWHRNEIMRLAKRMGEGKIVWALRNYWPTKK